MALSPTLNANSSNINSWDSLKKQARSLEGEIEAKLASYSRIAASSMSNSSSALEEGTSANGSRGVEMEIDTLLQRMNLLLDSMSGALEHLSTSTNVANTTRTSMMHILQRHRDVLYDNTREYHRTRANLKVARERAELVSSVQNDISSYKNSLGHSATDQLLSERVRIDNSHEMTDAILAQAYETRDEFGRQRSTLASVQGRMMGVATSLPGVNTIISKISTRRKRDSVILGVLIGVCFVLLMMYMSRT